MPGRFDDHLVGSDPVHLIVDPLPLSVQISFDTEGGELIGDDSERPSGGVGRSAIFPVGDDFRRGSILIPLTEGTEAADRFSLLWHEVRGPSTPFCGNDDPSTVNRIFSQFGHEGSSFSGS